MREGSLLVVLPLLATLVRCQDGSSCVTPRQEPGVCVEIQSCSSLFNILRTRHQDAEAVTFLRNSLCRFEGRTPLVCCATARSLPVVTTEKEVVSATLPAPPDCGFSNSSIGRVVGGVPAKLGAFPWMVALGYRNEKNPNSPRWLCGGSLITDRHVLTAAHCVLDDLYMARIGDLDLYDDQDGASPVNVPIVKALRHENYSAAAHINDIAILTLQTSVAPGTGQPVCLPVEEDLRTKNFNAFQVFVTGWGSVYFRGPSSSALQIADLMVVSTEDCKRALAKFNNIIIDNTVLCAQNNGKDACKGDSGGPLIYGRTKGKNAYFYQLGVVSYGYKCAEVGFPGVYTRVSEFVDWIKANLK